LFPNTIALKKCKDKLRITLEICSLWAEILHIYIIFFPAIWCLTLDPYPTLNVTRYNSQSFNCIVDDNWNSVLYNYGDRNIAFFKVVDGKCKDFADHSSGRYTTACNISTRTFYLTINNVTDGYNQKTIACQVIDNTGAIFKTQSVINVQCK
jgi:hypothetical protein